MSEQDEKDRKQDMGILEQCASKLAEHFTTVQIIVTRDEGETRRTAAASFGVGNHYARYGSVRAWLIRQEEDERLSVGGDDGEDDDE